MTDKPTPSQPQPSAPISTTGVDAEPVAIAMAGWDKPEVLARRIQAYGDKRVADAEVVTAARVSREARIQRDAWWESRGHKDGKGGCFYATPPNTIPGIRDRAVREERERINRALVQVVGVSEGWLETVLVRADKIERG